MMRKDLEPKISRIANNSDLIIYGKNGSCNQSHYESSNVDTNNFSIEEIEIFEFCPKL